MGWLTKQSRKKAVNGVVVALWVLGLCVAVFGPVAWRWLDGRAYDLRRGQHLACLSAAIHAYYTKYGGLPDRLVDIEGTGLYGRIAYRSPGGGLVNADRAGPRPIYLPVQVWNGRCEVIVAVEQGKAPWSQEWAYVILEKDCATRYEFVSGNELEKLLAQDNNTRAQMGDHHRWPAKLAFDVSEPPAKAKQSQ